MRRDIQIIMFDLGGVLVELGDSPFPECWLKQNKKFELSDWVKSDIALDFERGLIPPIKFAQAIKNDLELSATTGEIIEEFSKWPVGPYAIANELLNSLSQLYTLAILTNTNELHWPRIVGEFNLTQYCQHIFASHILNLAKPDLEVFEHVIRSMNVAPENVLFFDDNASNVNAAKSIGIQCHIVRGQEELQQKVVELKLLE